MTGSVGHAQTGNALDAQLCASTTASGSLSGPYLAGTHRAVLGVGPVADVLRHGGGIALDFTGYSILPRYAVEGGTFPGCACCICPPCTSKARSLLITQEICGSMTGATARCCCFGDAHRATAVGAHAHPRAGEVAVAQVGPCELWSTEHATLKHQLQVSGTATLRVRARPAEEGTGRGYMVLVTMPLRWRLPLSNMARCESAPMPRGEASEKTAVLAGHGPRLCT